MREKVVMGEPRSWLFVPADSEKKIAKALGGEADAIIFDLEDSVAEANKTEARKIAAAALEEAGPDAAQLWVRINPLDGSLAEADLAAIVGARPYGIMVPKTETGADIAKLASMLEAEEAAAAEAAPPVEEPAAPAPPAFGSFGSQNAPAAPSTSEPEAQEPVPVAGDFGAPTNLGGGSFGNDSNGGNLN